MGEVMTEWMSTKQLLSYLGISQRTMDRMAAKGKSPIELRKQIPGTSSYRYRKSDIDSWLESEGETNDMSTHE